MGDINLDYPGGSKVITRVLVRGGWKVGVILRTYKDRRRGQRR